MIRRVLAVAVTAGVAAVLAIAAWPEAFDWQRSQGVAQLVAFRGADLAAAALAAVLLTALGLVLRPIRVLAASLAIVLFAFAAAQGAIMLTRGIGAPDMPAASRYDVTVLSWNTLGDSVPAAVIARAAADNGATVIALPETTEDRAEAVAAILHRDGRDFTVHSWSQQAGIRARSTSLLIGAALGTYRVVRGDGDTNDVPSIVAIPSGGQHAPTIVAVHTRAPYGSGVGPWRQDLAWLTARCTGANTIMAGDFNATIDHLSGLGTAGGQVGRCHDGALATGNAAVGTWPTSMPALVGTPIDHVLATPNWRFTGFRVLSDEDAAGSDHRPVLARLTPAG